MAIGIQTHKAKVETSVGGLTAAVADGIFGNDVAAKVDGGLHGLQQFRIGVFAFESDALRFAFRFARCVALVVGHGSLRG